MALARFNNLAPDRQAEILEEAAHAFAEHGYDGTSYNALLADLGMGKSQAYYYFASKQDLFVTACARCYEEYYVACRELPTPTSVVGFWAHVGELNRLGFHYQKSHPIAAKLTLAISQSPARFELAHAVLQGEGSSKGQYEQWLALGVRVGAVRADLPSDFLIPLCMGTSAVVDGWFASRAKNATDEEIERWVGVFTDLSRRMLAPADFQGEPQ